ncbi:beta strand repeat-containing protein [Haloferula rosea]|uniref:Autotransporter-associated beta strand repeat protein n=1 Tax=Haloferula rosea TaxID=490093 RepID=A0A934VF71_9BACT|nr:autotransporter-associated beta strand repeat-containing protein [Haloferula rosea]MBK1828064.1 hypothetical protein [Haloferula rosea]
MKPQKPIKKEGMLVFPRVTRLSLIATAATTLVAHAQLTWDPDQGGSPFGGTGVWDTSTSLWWNGAANVVWDNSGGSEGVFSDAGGTVTLASGAGITVGDLTFDAGLGSPVVVTAQTDNEGVTIAPGGATWALNDNTLTFTNDQTNDTSLSMDPLDNLIVTGTGIFNTGVNPNGADWSVANANLIIDGPITLRGPSNTVGQFSTVSMADGSVFRCERNANQTFANGWVLDSGNVTFNRLWNERLVTYNGVVSGDGGMTIVSGGLGSALFTASNTFKGKVVLNGNMTINGDAALGEVPGAPVADQLTIDGGELRINAATTIAANRGITVGPGNASFVAGSSSALVIDSVVAGTGGVSFSGTGSATMNAANTYEGTTTVDGLTLNFSAESALGTAPLTPVADSLTLRNGALLFPNNTPSLDSNRGITLDNGGGIVASNSPKTYDGTITGTGPFILGRADGFANTLTLGADTHDYTGGTEIRKGRLVLGIDEALPSDTVVTIGATGGSVSKLYLNGKSQTIGGLVNTANNTRQVVNFDTGAAPGAGGPAGTLTIDVADGESYNFGSAFGVNEGQDRGNFNLVKDGLGTQSIGNVRINGTIEVNDGDLQVGGSFIRSADVTVNGGLLAFRTTSNAIEVGNVTINGGIMTLDDSIDAASYTVGALGILSVGDGAGNQGVIGGLNKDITNDGVVLFDRSGNLTYDGVISGSGAVQIDGGLNLTLSGTNTFTGPIDILNGNLILGSPTALPDLGLVTVQPGEVFSVPFDGSTFASSDLPAVSTTVDFVDPTAYLGLELTAGSITLADDLIGAHSLQVNGASADVLTIGTTLSYTGDTRIFQGRVDLTADNQLPAAAEMQIGGAGVAEFNLNGFDQTIAGLPNTTGSTRQINNLSANPSTLTLDVASGENFAYTANILEDGGGVVNLVKNGGGTQSIEKNGFTSYSGSATVNAGELRFRYPSDIDPASQSIVVNSGGTFGISVGGGNEWMTGDIDTLLANATFNAGSILSFRAQGGPDFDLTSDLSGVFGIQKLGTDGIELLGTNSFTGPTLVRGGELSIDAEDRLGPAPGVFAADHLVLDGGTLQATADLTLDDANRGMTVAPAGGGFFTAGFVSEIALPIDGTGELLVTGSNTFGTGLVQLTGLNPFAGTLEISGAPVEVSSADNLPLAANVNLNGTAVLQLAGNLDGGASDFTRSVGTGPGEIQWTGGGGFAAVGADRTIDLGGAGADFEFGVGSFLPSSATALLLGSTSATHTAIFLNGLVLPGSGQYVIRLPDGPAAVEGEVAGLISGSGGLSIRDQGAVILSNDNTYTGPTNVENTSTLLVNGDQTLANGLVTVTSGATLGGTGIIGGGVDVNGGGTLAPGTSVGTLTTADAVFKDNSFFEVEIDSSVPSADKLVVTSGDVTLNTDVTLVLSDVAMSPQSISPGTKLTIIDYTGWGLIGGFAGLADGDVVTVGGNSFELDYDDGETVTLTSIATNAYDQWVANNYPALVGGFGDDDDGDGVSNGFEWYFFDSDPLTAEGLGSPIVGITKTGPDTFTFVHRRPVDRTGLTENYEWSADLATWTPSGDPEGGVTVTLAPISVVADGPDYEVVTIEGTVSPGTAEKIFARLELVN